VRRPARNDISRVPYLPGLDGMRAIAVVAVGSSIEASVLITANLVAGGLLAFAFAMLEVSDSLILAQKQEHFAITTAIYDLFGALGSGEGMASALGVWSMVFLALTIIGASVVLGKKLGALFRV
jgi:hypothetical protein